MTTKNWNQMSSDQNDSWLNASDSQQSEGNIKTPQHNQPDTKSESQPAKVEQPKQKKERVKKQERPRNKFPTDSEILADLEAGKIEADMKIKIAKCNDEQELKAIQSNQLKTNMKEYKEGCYILYFKNRQNLIKFIKQKMEKKYKFKLGVYMMSEIQRSNKEKERGRNKQKNVYDKKQRKYQEKPQYHKKNYDKNEGSKKYKQGSNKNKKQQIEKCVKIDNKNIYLREKDITAEDVVSFIQKQKLFSQFKKLFVIFPLRLIGFARQVTDMCYQKHKFGIRTKLSDINFSAAKEEEIKLELFEDADYVKLEKSMKMEYLKEGDYFENCENVDMHVIGENFNFNEKQYFEQFRKNYGNVAKNKDRWMIKALGNSVGKVLRLYWILHKNFPKNTIKLNIGMEGDVAFGCAQVENLDEEKPKMRPKPDPSVVNTHLTN